LEGSVAKILMLDCEPNIREVVCRPVPMAQIEVYALSRPRLFPLLCALEDVWQVFGGVPLPVPEKTTPTPVGYWRQPAV
jgi:hypothetical protein